MGQLNGDSAKAPVPAVKGINTDSPVAGVVGPAVGVEGESAAGWGVYGHSKTGRGVVAMSEGDYGLRAHSDHSAGIRGSSTDGRGVEGWATKSEGVVGISTTGTGIWGQTEGAGTGVLGTSNTGAGVAGRSQTSIGVRGDSTDGRGVEGRSANDYGMRGHSGKSAGIRGSSDEGRGVEGWATNSEGIVGISTNGNGVWGQTDGRGIGVLGSSAHGIGVYGKGGRLAGFFEGNVEITGDLNMTNGDCAEDFDVIDMNACEPGTVMVLGHEGALAQCNAAYDKRVAGVISGAGGYRPGITLDKQPTRANRVPIGLLGKVYCKVDAAYGPIEVGDLLTTSPTAGHAMKADDPLKAFGAVLGKALRPLRSGQGLVPILITLQ